MSAKHVIGVDLGGTKIAVARFDAKTMDILEQKRVPTHKERGFSPIIEEIISLIEGMRTAETIAVGVGVPGPVQHETGVLLTAPNIPGSNDIPLRDTLREKIGLPVTIDNDVQCFTFAEAMHGAGKGHKVVVGIALGTGVGGGIVIDGVLFRGAHGHAGEIGHMLLQPGNPPYTSEDARGDVEQFFSGTAMKKRCQEAKKPEDYLDGEVCSFLRPDVFREVAWTCVNLSSLLDPSIIIIGGSTGMALGPHLPTIMKEWKQWSLPGMTQPIFATSVLPNAACLGAAALAKREL